MSSPTTIFSNIVQTSIIQKKTPQTQQTELGHWGQSWGTRDKVEALGTELGHRGQSWGTGDRVGAPGTELGHWGQSWDTGDRAGAADYSGNKAEIDVCGLKITSNNERSRACERQNEIFYCTLRI
jgi:hypothetical protein